MDEKVYNKTSNEDSKLNNSLNNGSGIDRDNAEWDRLSRKKQDPTRRGVAKSNMRATAQYDLTGLVGAGQQSVNADEKNKQSPPPAGQNSSRKAHDVSRQPSMRKGQTQPGSEATSNFRSAGAHGDKERRSSSPRSNRKDRMQNNAEKTNQAVVLNDGQSNGINGAAGAKRPTGSVVPRKKNSVLALSQGQEDIVRVKGGIDRPMLIIVIALICFGLVMVFSASYAYALTKTGDSFYYIKHQAAFAVVGVIAMIGAINVDYQWIKRATVLFFLIMVVFLIITPIYGLAAGVATRWIDIGGFRFQPSEVMKLALVLILALYFSRYEKFAQHYDDFWLSSTYGLFLPASIVGFVCILIMLENHFSCMIIMFLIGMIVIFSAGARKFWFAVVGGGGAVAALIAISLSSYARERIDVWLNPQNYAADDEVYQTLQGLYAVGSGGFLGVGLGNSRQKHLFVSQPQNDFIFSIVCEELGFVGAIGVVALFILLVWRGIVIALRAPDTYSQLVVIGIVGKVAIQALLNIGVVTALLPNTGISLPFFSYGGSALMMQIGEMGIVLGISRYSRKT